MGIGTSLGEYYEDNLDHHAGNNYVPDMKIINEPLVKKPEEKPDIGPPAIGDGGVFSTGKIGDKLLGTNGEERHQLWPERMVRDALSTVHDVGAGKIPMWSLDHETGEIHSSIEGIEAAQTLMPFGVSGGIPLRVNIRGPKADVELTPASSIPANEAARLARQPSNIQPDTEPFYRESAPRQPHENDTDYAVRVIGEALDLPSGQRGLPVRNPYRQESFDPQDIGRDYRNFHERLPPDVMNDHAFYRWGEYQPENSMAPRHEERWLRLNEAERARIASSANDIHDWGHNLRQEMEEGQRAYASQRDVEHQLIHKQFEDPINVMKKGNISLADDPRPNYEGRGHYVFKTDEGQIGQISVTLRNSGKEIRVNGLYGISGEANEIGRTEMKNFFKLIADKYTSAEYITGFRVSGARFHSGSGPAEARMKIPGRVSKGPSDPNRRNLDDIQRILEGEYY